MKWVYKYNPLFGGCSGRQLRVYLKRLEQKYVFVHFEKSEGQWLWKKSNDTENEQVLNWNYETMNMNLFIICLYEMNFELVNMNCELAQHWAVVYWGNGKQWLMTQICHFLFEPWGVRVRASYLPEVLSAFTDCCLFSILLKSTRATFFMHGCSRMQKLLM